MALPFNFSGNGGGLFSRRNVTIAVVLLLLWWLAPFATVPAGYRGVMTTFGSPSEKPYPEGLHLRVPLAQTMHLVNVSIQRGDGDGEAASRDLQTVHTRIALNYHIRPDDAVSVFRDLGNQPGERIIVPGVHEAVKAVTARFTAEDLVAKRTEVRDAIIAELRERLGRHGIVVDEFSIVNFEFSKVFNEAIEAKTTAEQLKLKADRDLARIRVEAEQRVARAQAEAEALRLQREKVTPELLRLREIENQARAIEKWNGILPNVSGGALPFIDVSKK
jgi:regulator of protease activity HflC (stomatin/prohibitin superfamily)